MLLAIAQILLLFNLLLPTIFGQEIVNNHLNIERKLLEIDELQPWKAFKTRYKRSLKKSEQKNLLQSSDFVEQTLSSAILEPKWHHKVEQRSLITRNSSSSMAGHQQHKCRIWIPYEALHKYSLSNVIQSDKSKKSKLIEICCPGYRAMQWRGKIVCRPVCENCRNGRCLEPGKCQCYDEFVQNDNGDCIFTCPLGCQNGRCYLDGSCQCDPGYKLDETRKYCRPICSLGCGSNPLHNCTAPEVCGCIKGYRLTDEGCQPVCKPECGIGGTCTGLNLCECDAGFTYRGGVCQADCYQKCDNGICYSRNRCICKTGYSYHERSTQCIPT